MQDLSFERKIETSEQAPEKDSEDKSYKFSSAEKTKSVLKIDHEYSGINSAWTFANDKFVGEVTGTVLDDDWKVKGGVGAEIKKVKGEMRGCGFLDLASPDMSGVKAALHVSKINCAVLSKH